MTSATLHGGETWCLKQSEMAISRRTERATVRAMWGVKLTEEKIDGQEEYRRNDDTLGLKEAVDKHTKANRVRWNRYVLRRKRMMF